MTFTFLLRVAARRLLRAPTFALGVIISLSLGIAAVLSAGMLVDSVYFRVPAGVVTPERVVAIGSWDMRGRLSYPDFESYARAIGTEFADVGAFASQDYSVRAGGTLAPARALLATQRLLPLLGGRLRSGRQFLPEENSRGATPVIIVSSEFWRTIGGTANPIGADVTIANKTYQVVGVLEGEGSAPDLSPVDVVLPLENAPWFGSSKALTSRNYQWLRVVGRLQPGVSLAQLRARSAIWAQSLPVNPAAGGQALAMPVRTLVDARRDPSNPTSKIALGLAGLSVAMLLIVCANVSALALARSMRAERARAIQRALGASRRVLVGEVLIELALLGLVAICVALWLSFAANSFLFREILGGTITRPAMTWLVAAEATGIAVTALVLCGFAPALRAQRTSPNSELVSGSATSARGRRWSLQGLVIAQCAIGLVLMFEAIIFGASLRKATGVSLGITLDHLLIADVDLKAAGVPAAERDRVVEQIRASIARLPGVSAVGMTSAAALPGFLSYPAQVRGVASKGGEDMVPSFSGVTPEYLPALGVQLKEGRLFTATDGLRPVSVVSEAFARAAAGNNTALIGRCISFDDAAAAPCAEVIGVIADRRTGPLDATGSPEIFLPLGSAATPEALVAMFPGRELAIRSTIPPGSLIPQVRAVLLDAVPSLPSARIRTADEYLERQYRAWRLGANVLAAYGVLSFVLVAFGVYGISNESATQRYKEFGVRSALGATPSQLSLLIVRDSLSLALLGGVLGVVIVWLLARYNQALLFDYSPTDWRMLAVAIVGLCAVAGFAVVRPALRAGRVDLMQTLRSL